MRLCPCCGGSTWDPLPDPHPSRSMLSDLRVVEERLDKTICSRCALVRRESSSSGTELFDTGYSLYDHAPGAARENERQALYASWIARHVEAPPASILDVGCGNGSLLIELRRRWPETDLRGIDPSAESTARARAAGINAEKGTLNSIRPAPASLVIAVNVVEHAANPDDFLNGLAAAAGRDGMIIIICPDGRRPSVELLFADHVWSFVPDHIVTLLDRAGYKPYHISEAANELGPFMMVAARRQSACPSAGTNVDAAALRSDKTAYLATWQALDGSLLSRCRRRQLICFGAGEAAGLLRAYAPETWRRVGACAVDGPEHATFGPLPVIPAGDIPSDAEILLGIRPAAQPRVAERFERRHHVVRWDDLVPA